MAHVRYRRLELDLVAVETSQLFLRRASNLRCAARWVSELELAVDWMLRARIRVGRGRDPIIEIPVTIHPVAAPENAVRAPPEVGSGRIAELWRQVGAESGLLPDGAGGLAGALGSARVRISRELSSRGRPELVANIEIPDLRIGLSLEGRRRTPRARDERHQQILAARLVGPLVAASAVSAADRTIRCATRGTGASRKPLTAFVGAAVALARQLEVIGEELPPPAAFEADIPSWRDAAGALGARLETAGPAVVGEHGELPFAIAPVWNQEGERGDLELAIAQLCRGPGGGAYR